LKISIPFYFFVILLTMFVGCSGSPTSPNSNGWVEVTAHAPFAGRYGLSGTVFNDSMWVIGGAANTGTNSSPVTTYYSDVWYSGNGSKWSQTNGSAPFGGRYGSQVLSFNGLMWLIGGNSNGTLMNDVWNTPDGTNWTNVLPNNNKPLNQFTGREDFGAVVFNNLMWVIAGWDGTNENDVWSSPDGVSWTQVLAGGKSSANHFEGRWGAGITAYNNALWIFSGASGTSANSNPTAAYADAWTSANGNNWAEVSGYIPYGPVYFTQAIVNNNLIWLMDGDLFNIGVPQNFVGTTSNGINWSSSYPAVPPRFNHLNLSFDNEAWIIGGCYNACNTANCPETVIYYNDVWHSP
jgi:leucine-zipper-like transcriptional regulator 1